MFSPHRLAPELPASTTTPESAFPVYYISDSIPIAPANWTLKVGGLVRQPMVLIAEHGAPLRVYSAVKLGYKLVKYLTEINFLQSQTSGYWENQGYEWFAGV